MHTIEKVEIAFVVKFQIPQIKKSGSIPRLEYFALFS